MSTRTKRRGPVPALRTIAVTAGEPAGIGPDICSTLLEDPPADCRVVLIGDVSLFGRSRLKRAPKPRIPLFDATSEATPGLELLHVPLAAPCVPGRLDPANARYVLDTLDAAIGGCAAGAFHAVVTAPVQKSIINEAGIPFTGHTEYLARQTGVRLPVMMLVGGGMRVALVTTHVPLRKVSACITPERLESVLRIIDSDLRTMFGLRKPRLLVLGLNPHAGESGHLGREEIDVLIPVLDDLRGEGMDLVGPLPADTLFTPRNL
ncbi:MAG TPA: 4-hydroxythreonine-4-phosphate dehydrogenase PdxA, partial [Steroidobacteraceae bacterium]|nr:4-hydroxythreonine-4-phosphate dehydrogenase PdxA [Steroidobacteraceae bacterium]